jgi:hypothetical protein
MLNNLIKNTMFATLILSSAALSPLLLAGDSTTVDPRIAKNITITGCLHAGAHSGQFVLIGVTERTPTGALVPVPYSIYRLDSTQDMKHLVGELVDVSGKVVSRDKKPGAVKIDVSAGEEDVDVEMAPRNTVTTKPFADSAAPDSIVELSRPVYRINVESVKAAGLADGGSSCR